MRKLLNSLSAVPDVILYPIEWILDRIEKHIINSEWDNDYEDDYEDDDDGEC